MNNFKEFLTEGRFAPLYHGLPADFAVMALRNNTMTIGLQNAHAFGSGKFGGFPVKQGFSMSRSFLFSYNWKREYTVVFEFDQIKLNQNNKIIPFNFFNDKTRSYEHASHSYKTNYSKYDGDTEGLKDYSGNVQRNKFPHGFNNQMEEWVEGYIKNLDRVLTRVIIRHDFRYGMLDDTDLPVFEKYDSKLAIGSPQGKIYPYTYDQFYNNWMSKHG